MKTIGIESMKKLNGMFFFMGLFCSNIFFFKAISFVESEDTEGTDFPSLVALTAEGRKSVAVLEANLMDTRDDGIVPLLFDKTYYECVRNEKGNFIFTNEDRVPYEISMKNVFCVVGQERFSVKEVEETGRKFNGIPSYLKDRVKTTLYKHNKEDTPVMYNKDICKEQKLINESDDKVVAAFKALEIFCQQYNYFFSGVSKWSAVESERNPKTNEVIKLNLYPMQHQHYQLRSLTPYTYR